MEQCTLCASDDSPGFYTGCMVKDGHAPEWECDGKGNLTRISDRRYALPTREQMERAGLATPGQSHCSEQENACEQDEGA